MAPKKNATGKRKWILLAVVLVLLVAARLALPTAIRWYVNRTLDQSLVYEGKIGTLRVHLWRGAYSIDDVRILKRTGNVPVPLFDSRHVDLALQWDALRHGRLVGRIVLDQPRLNFVQGNDTSTSQYGGEGPWLDIVRQLFPFKINQLMVHNGQVHFVSPDSDPPVDVALSDVEAEVQNLTNVGDEIAPLFATINVKAKAVDQANFQMRMKFDPFSYYPTFEVALRLLNLDVTRLNALTRAYGDFDFKGGWFDLVIEINSREGQLSGYVKPLFRNIQVFSLRQDLQKNPLEFFWQALIGGATSLLKNQPKDQFGTLIPVTGNMSDPKTDVIATVFNILRNAFIRAYLPRLEGRVPDIQGLDFGRGESVTEPTATGSQ